MEDTQSLCPYAVSTWEPCGTQSLNFSPCHVSHFRNEQISTVIFPEGSWRGNRHSEEDTAYSAAMVKSIAIAPAPWTSLS